MNRSLRVTLTWMTVCAGTVCMVALVALVSITSMMHLAVRYLSVSVTSVRVADEIELQLLMRHETGTPVARGATEAALRGALDWSERFVQSFT